MQQADPSLPYTWFNLGVVFKKQGELDAALAQFRGMVKLVPDLAVAHYQIGSILKAQGDLPGAVVEFETARNLKPRLAAPHFQLYGIYRQQKRAEQAAAELALFQEIKKENEDAAVPEDMEWSFYSEIYDPVEAPTGPPARVVYKSETIAHSVTGVTAVSLKAGARASLISWSAQGVTIWNDRGSPRPVPGLEDVREIQYVAPGDFDNDGFVDLAILTSHGAALYRNVNGVFRKHADLAKGSFRQALWLDFDHDYDLDLFLLGEDSKLLRNNGTAGFSDETARFPFVRGHALSATRFDQEPDTPGFDLVVSYQDRPGVLYRDRLGGNYSAVDLTLLSPGGAKLTEGDWNHDGRTDLAAEPDLVLWNRPHGFEKGAMEQMPGEAMADLDGSGHLSRARVVHGDLILDRDVTPEYGNWLEVALTGVKNLQSALGAKVEVKAGAYYGKETYDGAPLVFRLGPASMIETVRITWPNGLIQNELDQRPNRIVSIKEAPRLSGSCPMIFTWDGSRYRFITDVLGVAPLGASSADGQYFPVDHREYVSISSDQLKPRDGEYEIRIAEELREVTYLDQVQLLAVDHPSGVEIVSNEKFKSPPFPEFRLFGIDRRMYPIAAHDQNGADVLPKLLKHDSRYVDSFRREQTGVAERHTLDLDFGKAAPSNRAVLILDGWVDWADGSTFLGAAQEHRDLAFPSLQVKDTRGQWKTVIEDMGMPSGRPKRIAVDLTGKFLSDSREVRIVTNLCLYWDEIFLVENPDTPPAQLTVMPSVFADLHFRGFSQVRVDPERKQPESFDYDRVSETAMWNPTPGHYTRYGDVGKLLADADDRMVIMGSGDEVALRFDPHSLPPVPHGWTRDFLLSVDGWAKDADANTAYSQTVLPLPFHAMTTYPYPADQRYPSDAAHEEYQRTYNTRPALRLIRSLRQPLPLVAAQ